MRSADFPTTHVILSEAKNLLANRSPLPFDAAYLLRDALSLTPRQAVTYSKSSNIFLLWETTLLHMLQALFKKH